MEMTSRRVAGIAIAAFALLVVARPPRPAGLGYLARAEGQMSSVERTRRTLTQVQDTLRNVEFGLWSRHLRDSVQRTLAAMPAPSRDRIHVDARMPAAMRRHMELVYGETRARMPRGVTALPMFVVLDTTTNFRLSTIIWVEDTQPGAPACITIVRVRLTAQAWLDQGRMSRDLGRSIRANFPERRHFGLCSFEAAFGPPSVAMRRWLQEREFIHVASGFDPALAPRRLPFNFDEALPYFNARDNGAVAVDIRACAAGRAERCLAAIARPADRPVADIEAATSDWRWYGWGWNGAPDFMNTLASSLGPERFGALWHANEPPPEAYRRITGVPIDTMARRVLVGDTPTPVRVGAGLRARDALLTLLIAACLAALAALPHPRRRR